MLPEDDLHAALVQEASFQDERLYHYWDGERTLGQLVARTLKLSSPIAWDIYLLYRSGSAWKGANLPMPDFWMHQLDERPDLLLDPSRLIAEVQKAVEAVP